MSARVGPFEVGQELVRAPGAILVEAEGSEGQRRILQLVHLRAPNNDQEREARLAEEQRLARATASLVADGQLQIHAHGGSDGENGERILFWALPWQEARFWSEDEAVPFSAPAWQALAKHLTERLMKRHRTAWAEPLLAEPLLASNREDQWELLGVPLAVTAGWHCPSVPETRWAPEESEGQATPAGDLWRLGQVLLRLKPEEGLSEELEALLQQLVDETPEARPDSAEAVFSRLRQAFGDGPDPLAVNSWASPASPAITSVSDEMRPAAISTEYPSEEVTLIPDVQRLEPIPRPEVSERRLDFETVSERALSVLAQNSTHKTGASSPIPDAVALRVPSTSAVTEVETKLSELNGEGRGDDNPFEESTLIVRSTSRASATPPAPSDQAAIDALAASWQQPALPVGESPWSEVYAAAGAAQKEHTPFPGFTGDLPSVSPPRASETVISSPPTAALESELQEEDMDEAMAAAVSGFHAGKVVAGVLALLIFFGVFAYLQRDPSQQETAQQVAPVSNDLLLESDPPGAQVWAVADGVKLGQTPLRFLLPEGVPAEVILWSPDREPNQIQLPARGALKVQLKDVHNSSHCQARLQVPPGTSLEDQKGQQISPRALDIHGAAFVRVSSGQTRVGAQVVRCPDSGATFKQALYFKAQRDPVTIHLTEPAGVQASLDGTPLGPLPAEGMVRHQFAKIEVRADFGSETRWVPAQTDLEVHMPMPKEAPRPSISPSPVNVQPKNTVQAPKEEGEAASSPDAGATAANPDASAPSAAPERPQAPDVSQQVAKARKYLRQGKLRKAEYHWGQCLKRDPRSARCHLGLAKVYRRLGQSSLARRHARKARRIRQEEQALVTQIK